jgi:hypothetical protein
MAEKSAEDTTKNGMTNTSRRSFLTATGSLGVASLTGIETVGALTYKRRVPKYFDGDEVVETMKVPQAWIDQDNQAQEALENLNASYMSKDGVMETGLVRSEQTFGGKNGFDIEVVVDETQPTPDLPDAVSGVTVRVKEAKPDNKLLECKNTGNLSDYPGGINIFDDSPDSSTRSAGTSGYRVVYEGSEYILTAAHTFEDCGWSRSDETYQLDYQLGEVYTGDIGADLVLSDASANNFDIINKIREPDGTFRSISGYASESEISNRVSDFFDGYRKIGIATGKTTGGLGKKDITKDNCYDLRGEGVRGSADAAKGDSGGPAYSVENNDAYLLYHVSQGAGENVDYTIDCGGTQYPYKKCVGTAAYWVNNNGYKIKSS